MRKLILALLKMRLPMDRVLDMSVHEALEYCEAWSDLTGQKKSQKHLVLRKKQ
jgi:hypothetical protein